jgi:hypothetical protein
MTALLSSFGFVTALLVLLLNDLVLKHVAGGFVTGKLSDFAGLFVFPLFWSALLPRHRVAIHCVTAALFVWWKLPVSQPSIDFWNLHAPWSIHRTVDPTDLPALIAVVAAYWFSSRPRSHIELPALRWAVIPLALFSFAATTALTVRRFERTYVFRTDPADLRSRLSLLGIFADTTFPDRTPDELNVRIPVSTGGTIGALLHLRSDSMGAAITLRGISYHGFPTRHDSIFMISAFEQCFVQRLDSLLTAGTMLRAGTVSYPPGRKPPAAWCVR